MRLFRTTSASYEKHNDLYEQLASETIEAIKRAKRLETHQVENGFTLPLAIDANPFLKQFLNVYMIHVGIGIEYYCEFWAPCSKNQPNPPTNWSPVFGPIP